MPALPSQDPPAQISPVSLTDAGSSTPRGRSPSPNQTPTRSPEQQNPSHDKASIATTATGGTATASGSAPPAKRVKLTTAEKEARARELETKKKEREEQKATKAAERAKEEAEKQARIQEREALREAQRKEKEEQKRKKQEEVDEKKKRKEEEERKVKEEKEKKARSQLKLGTFFRSTTPKKPTASEPAATAETDEILASKENFKPSPSKTAQTEYQKLFKPFFLKDQTRLAISPFRMSEDTKDATAEILDEHIRGERSQPMLRPEDIASLFGSLRRPSGSEPESVRGIMERMQMGSDSQEAARQAREDLSEIPMKLIQFQQDVRPAYCGTATSTSFDLRKLGRNPSAKLLPLQYDYDSEAEWQDEEDGEDLDGDEDEEELEDEDDMDGFLDDSEDTGLARRVFQNDMEPDSSGICFEDQNRQGSNRTLHEFRMEFIIGKHALECLASNANSR